MGHTLPPFSQQFKIERDLFAEMRRALLLRDDKAHFDEMWNKAEFHVPAAEKAKHPLPITSILMCINLEQEKAIFRLEGKLLAQNQDIQKLEARIESSEAEKLQLRREIQALQGEVEALRNNLRAELLEIIYPSYIDAP
jgi:septal ring factor EnvC (AmiA/AmiB activator)